MPEFIQEVADFKSFIHGYQSSGATRLIRLGEMHLFKFYMDDDGWLVIRTQPLMRNGNPSTNPPFDCGLQMRMVAQNFLRVHQGWFHSSLCEEMRFRILLGIK